jgi:RNA polymerase sigma-70 factor (ECF subfamily)
MQDNKLIKALVLNSQLGNNSAFEQLYQMTVQQVFALTLRLTGNTTSAEKITKKSYMNAWARVSEKDEFSSFANWLKKMAIETVLRETEELKNAQKNNAGINSVTNEVEERFYNNVLEKSIRDLETSNKFVYVLHDIANLTHVEISQLLGLSSEEVKTSLAKTREHLIKLTEE